MDISLNKQKKAVTRFNKSNKQALRTMLDETKAKIVEHPAGEKLLIGAKDSGKTHIVKVAEIWQMETDPMCSTVGARKYSTASAKRLGASFNKTLIRVKQQGFGFPLSYKKSQNYFYRLKSKSNMLENQSQEYVSFDDENGLAGIDVQNGGYFGSVHIEEPALKDDIGKTPTLKEWSSAKGVIKDSVNRTRRDYLTTKPFHEPFKTTWWITMNDWDEDHPESDYAERVAPRDEFLRMNLGGYSPRQLLGNRELILANWDKIAKALVENHTWMKYNEEDDKLVVRMTKLANPQLREDDETREGILRGMQKALIENNNFEMARQLGMLYEGSDELIPAYNLPMLDEENVINSLEYISKDVDPTAIKHILGRSIFWDIDVKRRLTGTVTLITGTLSQTYNPFRPAEIYAGEIRIVTLPQVVIKTRGRGTHGENTSTYVDSMSAATAELMKRYPLSANMFGSHVGMDDDQGKWLSDTIDMLVRVIPDWEAKMTNPYIQVKTGIENNILARQVDAHRILDEGLAFIDGENRDLLKFIRDVPRTLEGLRKGQRIEKGKYEPLADFCNSWEGSWYPFKQVFPQLLNELRNEDFYADIGEDAAQLRARVASQLDKVHQLNTAS